jgi:sodium-dependent phosphate cotransporter
MASVNVIGGATKPPAEFLVSLFHGLPTALGGSLAIALGIGMIMLSVIYLGKLLRSAMTGRAQRIVDAAVGRGPVTGIASGTVVTVLVQSSSTTTSLVVPLAGAGVLTTRQVYPFTLGANIGTCITALLAATAITGDNKIFAMQIALAHLLYNVFGVLFFAIVPWLWSLPVRSATWLGNRVEHNRGWALGYLVTVFFALPGAVLGAEYLLSEPDSVITEVQTDEKTRERGQQVKDAGMEVE